jgi:hypothetical protein
MYKDSAFKERVTIISNSDIRDVLILSENYTKLIGDTPNYEEKSQLQSLRMLAKERIKKLEKQNA